VPVDEQDELFSRFFSAKSAPKRETLGAGLGLYIVKQIVDGHQGTVSAMSVHGHGSTFTMRLPVRPRDTNRSASGRSQGRIPSVSVTAP
jgi:signal transduction histidine kinase